MGRDHRVITGRGIGGAFAAGGQVSPHGIHRRAKFAQVAGADGVLADAVILRAYLCAEIQGVEVADDGNIHTGQGSLQGGWVARSPLLNRASAKSTVSNALQTLIVLASFGYNGAKTIQDQFEITWRYENEMELAQFLVKAKLAGYASQGEANERKLDDGGNELTVEGGEFYYRDRYYGFNPFVGEEVVFRGGKVVWAMNYYGEVLNDNAPAKQVYGFLQQAMRRVGKDRPFRGPNCFQQGDFEYRDESQGNIDQFTGVEVIMYRGQEVYRLAYHGGRVG